MPRYVDHSPYFLRVVMPLEEDAGAVNHGSNAPFAKDGPPKKKTGTAVACDARENLVSVKA